MNPRITSKIAEILNSGKSQEEQAVQIETLVSQITSELVREDRQIIITLACPMCMAEMTMTTELGFSDVFFGTSCCKHCKRSFSVHGNRTIKVTRITPTKETPCTGSQQLRLSGT